MRERRTLLRAYVPGYLTKCQRPLLNGTCGPGGGPLFCLFVEAEVNRLDGFFSFLFAMLLDEDDNDNSPPVPFLSRPLQQINTTVGQNSQGELWVPRLWHAGVTRGPGVRGWGRR